MLQPSPRFTVRAPDWRAQLYARLPAPAWLRLALAYFGYFGLLGSSQPFLAAVLQEHHFPTGAMGLTLALLAALTGTMPLLMTWVTARLGLGRTRTFRACAAATVVVAFVLFVQAPKASATAYVALLALLTASYAPLNAVLDGAALDLCNRNGWAFGRLRMMGSFGFIVTATGLGHLLPPHHVTSTVHAAVACLAGVIGLSAVLLPRAPRRVPAAAGLRAELSAKTLSPLAIGVLLVALGLHSASFGPYQYGFTLMGRELALAPLTIALGWSVGVVSEIAFFGLSGTVLGRLGWRRTLALTFVAAPLRWAALGLWPSPVTYFLAQLLHGPSFALFYAAAMAALSQASTSRRQARYQTWFCAMVAGLAPGPTMYLAGLGHGRMPLPTLFLWVTLINAVAASLLLVAARLPTQKSMRAQPRALRNRMAQRRLACAASRYALTGR